MATFERCRPRLAQLLRRPGDSAWRQDDPSEAAANPRGCTWPRTRPTQDPAAPDEEREAHVTAATILIATAFYTTVFSAVGTVLLQVFGPRLLRYRGAGTRRLGRRSSARVRRARDLRAVRCECACVLMSVCVCERECCAGLEEGGGIGGLISRPSVVGTRPKLWVGFRHRFRSVETVEGPKLTTYSGRSRPKSGGHVRPRGVMYAKFGPSCTKVGPSASLGRVGPKVGPSALDQWPSLTESLANLWAEVGHHFF